MTAPAAKPPTTPPTIAVPIPPPAAGAAAAGAAAAGVEAAGVGDGLAGVELELLGPETLAEGREDDFLANTDVLASAIAKALTKSVCLIMIFLSLYID
jgi:hypothetical protein